MFAKTFFVSVCVLCVSFFSVACAVAQEIDTLQYSLQEAVIVGDDVAAGDRSSVPLQVVRRSSIENLGLLNLSDAVKRMSGVDVRDYGGVGGLKTVSVRGMGAKHTAVSYDGVVVSDAQSGVVDLGRFPLENIEVVSLVIGEDKVWAARTARESASSSLLSLKTIRSRENMAYVKLQGGAFGYADVSAFANYASYAKSFKGASLFANYMRSDGM